MRSLALGENYVNTIIKRSLVLILFGVGICFFVADKPMPYVYGLVFGGSINILGFKLLELNAKKAAKMAKGGARAYFASNYFIRLMIYGMVLVVAAKANYINFLTTALSLLVVRMVIITDGVYDKLRERTR